MQSFYDGMTVIGSLVVMVLIIIFTYYASRWYAGKMSKTASGRYLKILDRVSLGSGCAMLVVQAGDKFYLVSASDKNVQMLCELTDLDVSALQDAAITSPFNQLFQGFLSKSGNSPKDNGKEK